MSSETGPIRPVDRRGSLSQREETEDEEEYQREWVGQSSLQLIMQFVTTTLLGVLIGLVAYQEFGMNSITELLSTPWMALVLSAVTVCLTVVFGGVNQTE